MSMQNSWGQSSTQSSSPSGQPQPSPTPTTGDVSYSSLSCATFSTILSAPLPAASNIGEHRRPSAKAPHPNEVLKCPRCESLDTKFCYYNNYSLTQPRYFCKNCKRYWTAGGALRNVPVGGGLRKNKRSKLKLAAAAAVADAEAARAAQQSSAGGLQPQSGHNTIVEASQILERTTSLPASAAMPSHVVVGVPEIPQLYAHSSGEICPISRQVSDNRSSSTHGALEPMVDQNGAHAPSTILPQAGNFYVKEETNAGVTTLFCDPIQVPQFYPNYAAPLPLPFASVALPSGVVPGYAVNYSLLAADPSRGASSEECSNSKVGVMGDLGVAVLDSTAVDGKQENDLARGTANAYDWQLPDGLFNGTGASESSFLYTPSSSWPDFSQFNDTGPE